MGFIIQHLLYFLCMKKHTILLGLIGLITGFISGSSLSETLGYYPLIAPGLIFGLGSSLYLLCIGRSATRRLFVLFFLVSSLVAFFVASYLGYGFVFIIGAAGYFIAGVIGAFILGLAFIGIVEISRHDFIFLIILGGFLGFAALSHNTGSRDGFLLYIVWQTGISAMLGWFLDNRKLRNYEDFWKNQ